jgi:hypothetical protein
MNRQVSNYVVCSEWMHDCTKQVGRIPIDKNYSQFGEVSQLLILATGIPKQLSPTIWIITTASV